MHGQQLANQTLLCRENFGLILAIDFKQPLRYVLHGFGSLLPLNNRRFRSATGCSTWRNQKQTFATHQ